MVTVCHLHLYDICMYMCYLYIIFNSFPGQCEELRSPPCKKVYNEMKSYHLAYDNAMNRYVSSYILVSDINAGILI